MNRSLDDFFAVWLRRSLTVLLLGASSLAAGTTILVTDVDGEVKRAGKPIDLLTRLAPAEHLLLAPAARAVVVYLGQAREYLLVGPGEYRVETGGLVALPGAAKPGTRALPAVYREVKLDTARLGQAGVRLRAEDTEPDLQPSGLIAQAPVMFHWPPAPGAEGYVFRLADAKRNLMYEARLQDPALSLPASVRLKPGAPYYWGVEAPGSGRDAVWTQIRIATNTEFAKRIAAARPAATAPPFRTNLVRPGGRGSAA